MSESSKNNRYISRALQETGAVNRAVVAPYLEQNLNQGLSASSVYNQARVLRDVDRFLAGRPITAARPDDLQEWLTSIQDRAHATRWQYSILLRAFLKWALKVKDLPHDLDAATHVRVPPTASNGRVLTDEAFYALLEASTRSDGPKAKWARPERIQAILWTLWDTGLRAQELLSLKVGSITWDGPSGARLTLPLQARTSFRLKTGPRSVYVVECVGPLRVWLALHPAGDNPDAPLFPHSYDRTGLHATQYLALAQMLRRLGNAAGLNQNTDQKAVSAHDFRHTRATRAARAGWMEAELRAYFGWAPGSSMPSIYVHLAMADMRGRIRRDAGVEGYGYTQAVDAGDDEQALSALLQRILQKGQGGPVARTSRPGAWTRP